MAPVPKRTIRLPKLDPRSLPGPDDIRRWELANGIVLLVRENHASPSVVLTGYVAASGLGETNANAGLAYLTAGALMRGTHRQSFQEIYESVESIGASLGFSSGKHKTNFHGKALAEDLGLLLGLLADALRQPTFPPPEVERLRAERLTALNIRDQDTGSVAALTFDRLVYPGHPYAIPSDGTKESVAELGRPEVADFHRKAFGPTGMVLAVVGAVRAEAARSAVEAALGDWVNPGQTLPASVGDAPRLDDIRQQSVTLAGKSQCDLVVGAPGPSRTDPDYLPAALGNSVLGRFGLYGRVGDAVRENAGLAYYAYSSLSGGHGPGPWSIVAGVNPVNVEKAIDLIRREIGRFVARRVTAVELEENQAHFIGRLPLQLESNEGVAGSLLNIEQYDLGLDYYVGYPERVAAITREAVLAAAQRFLSPDRLAIAVAGPPLSGGSV
jgi:zinc protease